MMRKLRRLKPVMHGFGIKLRAEWLTSVVKVHEDRLSRLWHTEELQVRGKLRCFFATGKTSPRKALKFRPTGDSPLGAIGVSMEVYDQGLATGMEEIGTASTVKIYGVNRNHGKTVDQNSSAGFVNDTGMDLPSVAI